jgi:hypothetical protein
VPRRRPPPFLSRIDARVRRQPPRPTVARPTNRGGRRHARRQISTKPPPSPREGAGETPTAALPAGHVGCASDPLRRWRDGSWLVGGGGLGLVVGTTCVSRAERRHMKSLSFVQSVIASSRTRPSLRVVPCGARTHEPRHKQSDHRVDWI